MNDELPQGWVSTRVGELFSSHGGGTPNRATATYWNGSIPWLSSGDIKATSISESSETITKLGLEESSARMCRKGSVLVVVRSGILKHTLPVAVLEREAAINQDIKSFDSGFDELNRWLSLAWRASARKLLGENREGTTVQSVKLETLNDFVLPLPPLPEQRRIVVMLETLVGKVEASQQRLAKIPVLLKRFRQSVLAAACSGRLTADWREENPSVITQAVRNQDADLPEIPERWRWAKLPETGEMTRGRSRHRPRNEPSLYGGPYPFIQTGDIAQSGGRITRHRQTYSDAGLAQSRLWEAGTISPRFSINDPKGWVITLQGRWRMGYRFGFSGWWLVAADSRRGASGVAPGVG